MEKTDPDQKFLAELEALWLSQPVPPIPDPPRSYPPTRYYAWTVAVMVMLCTLTSACAPRLEGKGIDCLSLPQHASVNESITSILAGK